jgi:hypothetical protein
MILNGSAHGLGFENKHNKQSLKIGHTKKLGMLNVIKQLQHFILCNMMCNVALKRNIDRDLRSWLILLFSAP